MNVFLLSVLALSGAGDNHAYSGELPEECTACEAGSRGKHHCAGLGPMPHGCRGSYADTRLMPRYPAFHGYYYRSAYNYRHYFDYPWHAGLGDAPLEEIDPPLPVPADDLGNLPSSVIRSAHVLPLGRPTPPQPRNLRR